MYIPTSSKSLKTVDQSTLSNVCENTTAEHDGVRGCQGQPTELLIEDQGSKVKQPKGTYVKISKTEMKLTIMALAIAIANVVCFVPYYLSVLLIKTDVDGKSIIFTVGEAMAKRSYVLYSIVSPFIVMYHNESLKHFIVNICRRRNNSEC
ncbi:hypothetical protein ACF0H5_022099 [Mactra antiquata]